MQTRKSKGAVVVPCAKFLKCNSGRWMDGSGYFWLSSTYLSLQDTRKAPPVQLFQPNQLSLSDKPKTRVDAQVLHGWLLTDEGGFYPSFYLNTTCSTQLSNLLQQLTLGSSQQPGSSQFLLAVRLIHCRL